MQIFYEMVQAMKILNLWEPFQAMIVITFVSALVLFFIDRA